MNNQQNDMAKSVPDPTGMTRKGKRRLITLVSIILGLIIAVSTIWFFVSWKVTEIVDQAIAGQAEIGNDIDCQNRETTGYPFRIGIRCQKLAATLQDGQISFESGQLRTAAQIYDPGRAVGELDAPFTLHAIDGETLTGQWDNARLSIKTSLSGELQRFAILFEEPKFETTLSVPQIEDPILASGEKIEFYMRQGEAENSVDLAWRLSAIGLTVPKGAIVLEEGPNQFPVTPPPFNTTFNANLEEVQDIVMSGGDLASYVQDNGLKGFLRELAMQPVNGGLLHLSGPFRVNTDGLVSGEFQLKFSGFGKILAFMAHVDPKIEQNLKGFEPIIEQLAKPVESSGDTQDAGSEKVHVIQFKVVDGKIRLGLFELGEIPAIF